jgi:hypothetical protein
MASVIENRLDQVEIEMAHRKAEHAAITARLDRRRHWWVTLFLAGIVMAGVAIGGSVQATRAVIHETRQREAETCESRREARQAARAGYIALLAAPNPVDTSRPLIAADSPLRRVLEDDVLAKLPPITC